MSVCPGAEVGVVRVGGEEEWPRSRMKTLTTATIQASGIKKPIMKS